MQTFAKVYLHLFSKDFDEALTADEKVAYFAKFFGTCFMPNARIPTFYSANLNSEANNCKIFAVVFLPSVS